MPDRLITIAHFQNYLDAELAKQLLDNNGIESVIVGENASILYYSPAIETTQLQVFESQSRVAMELLSSQKQNQ